MNEKEPRPMGRRIYVVGNTSSGKSTLLTSVDTVDTALWT
jgi:ABC-type lipoprotein export system ATPase subunit